MSIHVYTCIDIEITTHVYPLHTKRIISQLEEDWVRPNGILTKIDKTDANLQVLPYALPVREGYAVGSCKIDYGEMAACTYGTR